MGFWFFLSVVVIGHTLLKAYKLRMISRRSFGDDGRVLRLEAELNQLKKQNLESHTKLEQLEEAVYFGDFELKRQFNKLESEVAHKARP